MTHLNTYFLQGQATSPHVEQVVSTKDNATLNVWEKISNWKDLNNQYRALNVVFKTVQSVPTLQKEIEELELSSGDSLSADFVKKTKLFHDTEKELQQITKQPANCQSNYNAVFETIQNDLGGITEKIFAVKSDLKSQSAATYWFCLLVVSFMSFLSDMQK